MKKKLIVLTGAGVSAESGIKTFRDADGLWEGYDITKVASPIGWNENPAMVLDFYNQRRKQLLQCKPNKAHELLHDLEKQYDVFIITQNIDNLHEMAGSTSVLHLHGELLKARSTLNENLVYPWTDDIHVGTCFELGSQLRPHIVWFGEAVPKMELAINQCLDADLCIVIGSSLQVYPAAGLISYLPGNVPVYYIDPKPASTFELNVRNKLKIIKKTASEGMKEVYQELMNLI